MITVKLFGGAKKSFSSDNIKIENNDLSIKELLDLLITNKPEKNKLDVHNLLVAVNGIDSSAIDGNLTRLKNGDVVSIMPIIHGGSSRRIQFRTSKSYVELFYVKASQKLDIDFLDEIREKFPNLIIQAISSRYILCKSHAKKIIAISEIAKQNKTLLSNKIETDILLRFAGTTQITDAIKEVGIKMGRDIVIIAIGKKIVINKLFCTIKPLLSPYPLSENNLNFLRKKFDITNKQMNTIKSKTPMEDLLAEKAAILI